MSAAATILALLIIGVSAWAVVQADVIDQPPKNTAVAISGKKIIARFNDLPPILPGSNRLLDLQASVEAHKVQSRNGGGVRLTITISNNGSQSTVIANPLDYLIVIVNDKTGQPVELPPSYSRFLIDGHEEPGDADKFHLPFVIDRTALNNRKLSLQETEQHSYVLDPQEQLQITVQVNKIVTSSKLVPIPGTTSFEPSKTLGSIPPGRYQVKLQLLLFEPVKNETSRSLETGILHIGLT